MYQTLHCHTRLSDGQLGHRQILNFCAKNSISVVAFTDHDYLPDKKIVKELKDWKDARVKWIIGCELSSGLPKELGGGPASNFHIVGLFVNPFDKALKRHCQRVKQGRQWRMRQMVKNMRSLGLKITVQDCLKQAQGEVVGRTHIAAVLEKKKENRKVIAALMEKMFQAAKNDLRAKQKYQEALRSGRNQYPYKLFLDREAFFPGIFVEHPYLKDMDGTVGLIRQAGGLAILAHWTFNRNIIGLGLIEKFFKQRRLDGAEIIFGRPGYDRGFKLIKRDMAMMTRLTRKYNLVQAGGPDIHRKKEFSRFLGDKWFAEKTIGLAEKIVNQTGLTFSLK